MVLSAVGLLPSRPAPRGRTGRRRGRPAARWWAARTRRPGRRAARRSTGRASKGSERVSAATRRVFHGATSPASTFAQSRGNRCRRSRASAINDIADWVETPIAAPSSSATKAATAGVPSPPREASQSAARADPRRPRSPYPTRRWPGAGRTTRRRCRSLVSCTIAVAAARPRRQPRAAAASSRSSTSIATALTASMHPLNQRPPTPKIGPETLVHRPIREFRDVRSDPSARGLRVLVRFVGGTLEEARGEAGSRTPGRPPRSWRARCCRQ